MNWSHFQRDIYEAFEHSRDSLLIEAVAGSGKTSTLIELANIMQRAFPSQRAVIVAFNKSIAMELQSRITARNVQAMTLHSAGWSAWRRAGGLDWEPRVDSGKVSGIMREVLSWEENRKFGETTRRLVGYAKGAGLLPHPKECHRPEYWVVYRELNLSGLVDDTPEAWEALIDHYGLDEEACNIDLVRKVLARSIELARESCDFDDMLYMPVVAGVPFDRYDVVLVDEAQDVSGIQMEMIGRMVADTFNHEGNRSGYSDKGRVIAVGDRHQAIYGFRGAGTTSMDEMRERFQMRELPLSVSYRCPIAVVERAKQWVPQIEAREDAEDGVVMLEGTDWAGQAEIALGAPVATAHVEGSNIVMDMGFDCPPGEYTLRIRDGISKWRGLQDFRPGDAILCRLTRPLVAAAFTLIRRRVAGVHVLGRDIGKGLVDLIRKAKMQEFDSVDGFVRWLVGYHTKETERLRRKGKYAQAGLLNDKVMTIEVFVGELATDMQPHDTPTVRDLIRAIEQLFVDANGGQAQVITLATVHKAKGLEWSRVFVLDAGELMPCPWARRDGWEIQQEINCMYIAATRAMHELRYITTADLKG